MQKSCRHWRTEVDAVESEMKYGALRVMYGSNETGEAGYRRSYFCPSCRKCSSGRCYGSKLHGIQYTDDGLPAAPWISIHPADCENNSKVFV